MLLTFLALLIHGILISCPGILLGEVAYHFQTSIAHASNLFTFLNAGIFVGIGLNLSLLHRYALKQLYQVGFAMLVLALGLMWYSDTYWAVGASLFLMGLAGSVGMSNAFYLIAVLYKEGRDRNVYTLFADVFFSIGACLLPILVAHLVAHQQDWRWVFVMLVAVDGLIFLLASYADFPKRVFVSIARPDSGDQPKEALNKFQMITIPCICLSAFLFIIAQLGFMGWVPQYVSQLGGSLNDAASISSAYWFGLFVGILAISQLLRVLKIFITTLVLGVLSTLFALAFTFSGLPHLKILIFAFGFCSGPIYTALLVLGSMQFSRPSQRLISLILMCGMFGTFLTFVLTTMLVEYAGIHVTLVSAGAIFGILSLLLLVIMVVDRYQKLQNS